MPEYFRHFHDFPVDSDMVQTGGSQKFRHFQSTVHPPVRTMSLKCQKISGTFKICGTSAMKGQSPTGLFLEVPLNYSTFYFCAIGPVVKSEC